MGLAFVAEEAVAWDYFLQGFNAVLDLEDGTFATEDKDGLATVVMGVDADGSAWDQTSLEHSVFTVEEHICMEFLIAALESGECAYCYFVKLDYHFQMCLLIQLHIAWLYQTSLYHDPVDSQ